MNSAYARRKQVKIVNKASIGIPVTKFDKVKIEEVVENLINNAIKYALPETVIPI